MHYFQGSREYRPPPPPLRGLSISEKACPGVSMSGLPRICTNDANTTALSDVNCLFSIIEELGIQEATFDAIFDSITNTIGRYFYLHIVKSMPCNQACKSLSFLIFILTFTWEWLSSWSCDQTNLSQGVFT